MSNKILLISSKGGHWIQLKRIAFAFKGKEIYLVSTSKESPVFFDEFCKRTARVSDASRWNKFMLIKQAIEVFMLVIRLRPNLIVTTGASVGLWALLIGRIIRSKTVWIDSLANYDKISLSGRLAKPFADFHLTQWEHLAVGKTIYRGTVL